MMLFIGDIPSSKNIDPDVPFVGTRSYKVLLQWIWGMDLDISQIVICNKDDMCCGSYNKMEITANGITTIFDSLIALGNNASKKLDQANLPHFKLPHPSGKNLKLNDSHFVEQELKKCKEYLNSQ